jgi:hypothetical protein
MSKLQIGTAGRPWIRGVAVLAVLGALTVAAISSPVGAAGSVTRKQVKKIATRQIKKLAPTLNVATAETLANVTVQREEFTVADNTANGALAQCPAGQQVIGGGVITGANDAFISNSVPAKALVGDLNDGETFSAWRGFVVNQLGGSGTITSTVYAVCAG